ncbi:MAG TPA: DUF58 domain-containing protein [Firmicutes bacterium]|jgi:uncharacterized protein (DUF58 family)|nr:DUF58 domain-containing protein [Bacillota bacterium]HOQ24996.1 DUF58 domain-containing protein [Bacillota bacterium]HPT68293.1 DUF58 domain-containing protein [Bacillota bacterium]
MRSLVLILFFTGVVLFLPGPLFQRMLYFLLGLVLWVRRANRIVGEKIVVQVDTLHSKGFVGDDLFLTLKVANPTGFPVFWCTVRQSFPEGIGGFCQRWALALDAREKKELKVGFRGQRRGIFPVPDVRLTHGDAWGITEKSRDFKFTEQIIIYPAISPVAEEWIERHLPLGRQKIIFGLHEDQARLRGCREYRPGDSMKRIHWPSSARTGRLQAKDWETTLNSEIGIFLNLAEEDYPAADWFRLAELGIECAASLVVHLYNRGEKVGFFSNGKSIAAPAGGIFSVSAKIGKRQDEKILTYLAGADLAKGQDQLVLLTEARRLPVGASPVIITPNITRAMVEKAHGLRRSGYHPVFLWLRSHHIEIPEAELKLLKVPVVNVIRERETDAVCFC